MLSRQLHDTPISSCLRHKRPRHDGRGAKRTEAESGDAAEKVGLLNAMSHFAALVRTWHGDENSVSSERCARPSNPNCALALDDETI
jgi:hypothetical protein